MLSALPSSLPLIGVVSQVQPGGQQNHWVDFPDTLSVSGITRTPPPVSVLPDRLPPWTLLYVHSSVVGGACACNSCIHPTQCSGDCGEGPGGLSHGTAPQSGGSRLAEGLTGGRSCANLRTLRGGGGVTWGVSPAGVGTPVPASAPVPAHGPWPAVAEVAPRTQGRGRQPLSRPCGGAAVRRSPPHTEPFLGFPPHRPQASHLPEAWEPAWRWGTPCGLPFKSPRRCRGVSRCAYRKDPGLGQPAAFFDGTDFTSVFSTLSSEGWIRCIVSQQVFF